MLEAFAEKTTTTTTTTTNKAASACPSLFFFVPRQVAIANQRNMKSKKDLANNLVDGSVVVDETPTVESIKKKDKSKKKDKKKKNVNSMSPFILSIAVFLQEQGFTKTLAAFQSEASIPDEFDRSKVLAFNEEMYTKCLDARECDVKESKNDSKELDMLNDDTKKDDLEESKDGTEEKKKRNNKGDVGTVGEQPEDSNVIPQCVNDSADKSTKSKVKKKKSKPGVEIGSETIIDAVDTVPESQLEETNRKSKDKKKKKSKLISAESGGKDLVLEDNNANIDNRSCKKRKRMVSEGNERQISKVPEEEKEKEKENELVESEGHAGKKRKTVNDDTKTSNGTSVEKKLDVLAEEQEKKMKQQNGSAEPKKAFQRVKIEEVKFADDRLQDNSYWAKGGADVGYGAKAQEVLGQVRGRDFRHEKTKKKRGSYRGGQIDLQTHSVKFNYSDED